MSAAVPRMGRAGPAPARFPYYEHRSLAEVYAVRPPVARRLALPPHKIFCSQCDRTVTRREAGCCAAPFCKAGAA